MVKFSVNDIEKWQKLDRLPLCHMWHGFDIRF